MMDLQPLLARLTLLEDRAAIRELKALYCDICDDAHNPDRITGIFVADGVCDSRPHVSNDNPYSEAQFKTLKYRPAFPARFASIDAAGAHCQEFFPWYDNEHHHGGLGLHTAADVHHGRAAAVQAGRAQVLDAAYHAHPERFVSKPPAPPDLPGTSWINPPQEKESTTQ
jgi:hypothetical protein